MDINFSKQVPRPSIGTMTLNKKRSSLIELVIMLIVGILFYWFIISPKAAKVNEQNLMVGALKTESAKLADQQAKLKRLIEQLKSSSQDIAKLDESLPLHPRTTWVYLLMENLVQSSGMTLSSLTVSSLSDETLAGDPSLMQNPYSVNRQIKKMSANIGVTGTFSQFQAFLKKIENSARILDVKTLDISSSSDELLDFRISFDTYYFAP